MADDQTRPEPNRAPDVEQDTEQAAEQSAEEERRLKEAVARLGASLREESERLSQDEVDELPIAAAPRARSDPRLEALAHEVAALVELEHTTAQRVEVEAAEARGRDADVRRLAVAALALGVLAVVIAVAALVAAVAR